MSDNMPAAIYPAQCKCGHLYLEKYQWQTPLDDGQVGFCWCGFCRSRFNVYPYQPQDAARGSSEAIRKSVTEMNKQVAADAKMLDDAARSEGGK